MFPCMSVAIQVSILHYHSNLSIILSIHKSILTYLFVSSKLVTRLIGQSVHSIYLFISGVNPKGTFFGRVNISYSAILP